MEEYMMVCGKMENNMEEENLFLKMEWKDLESGEMERKSNGYD
jgi:hypothetical protein